MKQGKTESVMHRLRALVDEYKADYPEERAIWEIESYSLTADTVKPMMKVLTNVLFKAGEL